MQSIILFKHNKCTAFLQWSLQRRGIKRNRRSLFISNEFAKDSSARTKTSNEDIIKLIIFMMMIRDLISKTCRSLTLNL